MILKFLRYVPVERSSDREAEYRLVEIADYVVTRGQGERLPGGRLFFSYPESDVFAIVGDGPGDWEQCFVMNEDGKTVDRYSAPVLVEA